MLFLIRYCISTICFTLAKIKKQDVSFINFNNKVQAMTLIYVLKLNLKVCYTNIEAQKINGSILKLFKIVLASF